MKRHAGTQNGRQHQLVGDNIHRRLRQRSLYVRGLVVQHLAQLDRHDLTDTLDVPTETETILLDIYVADLPKEILEHAMVLRKVDNFHYCMDLAAFCSVLTLATRAFSSVSMFARVFAFCTTS